MLLIIGRVWLYYDTKVPSDARASFLLWCGMCVVRLLWTVFGPSGSPFFFSHRFIQSYSFPKLQVDSPPSFLFAFFLSSFSFYSSSFLPPQTKCTQILYTYSPSGYHHHLLSIASESPELKYGIIATLAAAVPYRLYHHPGDGDRRKERMVWCLHCPLDVLMYGSFSHIALLWIIFLYPTCMPLTPNAL